jgi:hypothetical protein
VPSSVWLRRASRRKELLSHARAPRGYVVRCWLEHRGVPLHRPPGAQEEAPPLQACVVNLPTAKAVELDWARATLPVELACARVATSSTTRDAPRARDNIAPRRCWQRVTVPRSFPMPGRALGGGNGGQ